MVTKSLVNEIIQLNKMLEIVKKLDAKTVTNIGGLLIAFFLGYIIWDLSSNKITNIAEAVTSFKNEDISAKKGLTDALIRNAEATEGNTKVTQQFQQFLINLRQ